MLLPAVIRAALLVVALGATAAVDSQDFYSSLSDCWQKCLRDTGDGCNSAHCICDASQSSSSYLPDVVSCAATQCNIEHWALDMSFLLPVQAYCGFAGVAIPASVMSSAYAAATSQPAQSTHNGDHSQSASDHKQTSDRGSGLTTICTTTITQTTVAADGQTLEVIVPLVMGPNTWSYGKTVTSTLNANTATSGEMSVTASPSPTAEASAPASTQAQQSQAAPASTTSRPPQKSANSNGSPFENMQAGEGRIGIVRSLMGMGMGAVAAVFLRL